MRIDIITNRAKLTEGQAFPIDNHTRFLPRGTFTLTLKISDFSAVKITEGHPDDLLTVLNLDGVVVVSSGVIS